MVYLMDKLCAGQCTFNLFAHETTATALTLFSQGVKCVHLLLGINKWWQTVALFKAVHSIKLAAALNGCERKGATRVFISYILNLI